MNPDDPATNPEADVSEASAADDAVPLFRPSRRLSRESPRTLEAVPRVEGPPSELGPVTLGDGPVSVPSVGVLDTAAFEGLSAGTSASVDARRWAIAIGLTAGGLVGLGLVALVRMTW